MVARRVTFFVVIVLPIPIINLFSPAAAPCILQAFRYWILQLQTFILLDWEVI